MSSETRPISPTRFLLAIQDLPVGNLHAKAAELRNSINHLQKSNAELAEFPDDADLKQAIQENEEVIQRMEDRILMLKGEVEKRGLRWVEGEDYKEGMAEPGATAPVENGGVNGPAAAATNGQTTASTSQSGGRGRLSDDELRRLLAERMGEGGDEDGDAGVHL